MRIPDSHKARNIARHIERLKGEVISRWREEVRRLPEQAALIRDLDDQELQDHLPALTEKVIKLLRAELTQDLEEDAAPISFRRNFRNWMVSQDSVTR